MVKQIRIKNETLVIRNCTQCPIPVSVHDRDLCQKAFDRLDRSYAISKLPEKPDPEPFTDFLYRIRMKEVLSNNIRLEIKKD